MSRDPALEARIEALGDKLRRYEAPAKPAEPPKDLVQLKKKGADGRLVRAVAALSADAEE
jgi:hypothetical protein